MERLLEQQQARGGGEGTFPVPARRMSIDTSAARRGSSASSFKTPRKQMPRVLPPVSGGGASSGFATPRVGAGSGVSETPSSSKRALCPSAPGRTRSAGRNRFGHGQPTQASLGHGHAQNRTLSRSSSSSSSSSSSRSMLDDDEDDEEEEHVEKDLLAELAEEHVDAAGEEQAGEEEEHAAAPSWTTYTPVQPRFGSAARLGAGGASGGMGGAGSGFKRISPHGGAAAHMGDDDDDDLDDSFDADQENRHGAGPQQHLGFGEHGSLDAARRGLSSAPASLLVKAPRCAGAAMQPLDEVELPSIFNMAQTMTTRTPKKLHPLGGRVAACTSEEASRTVPLSAAQRSDRRPRHLREMEAAATGSSSSSGGGGGGGGTQRAATAGGPPPQLVKSWGMLRRNRKRVFEDMSKQGKKPLPLAAEEGGWGGEADSPDQHSSIGEADSPPLLPRQQQMRKLSDRNGSPLPSVSFGQLPRRSSDLGSLSSAMGGMQLGGMLLPPPGLSAGRR